MIEAILDNFLIPFISIVGPILVTVLAGLATNYLIKLRKKIGIETDAAEEAVLRQKIRGAILHTNQTLVKQLRLKKSDGHLSKEEAIQAAGETFKMSVRDLGTGGVKALIKLTGKGEGAVREVIEEEVAALNLIPKSSATPPAS